METEQNKATVGRFVKEVFERLNTDAVDELVADDFVSHTWARTAAGAAADKAYLKAATSRMGAALSDIRFEIEDVIAEKDRVAVRVAASATASGDFMGLPAAGKSYRIGEIHIFRLRDGRIVEHWHQYDAAGMMRQLGG